MLTLLMTLYCNLSWKKLSLSSRNLYHANNGEDPCLFSRSRFPPREASGGPNSLLKKAWPLEVLIPSSRLLHLWRSVSSSEVSYFKVPILSQRYLSPS